MARSPARPVPDWVGTAPLLEALRRAEAFEAELVYLILVCRRRGRVDGDGIIRVAP